MVNLKTFLAIAAEALLNPRTANYKVAPLNMEPKAYPFKQADGTCIPAVAVQFEVVGIPSGPQRVITISYSALGYAVWCGDRFTQGDLPYQEAFTRVQEALSTIPAQNMPQAATEMLGTIGSYKFSAPCHFWKAWTSHQGVCKHIAAVFQSSVVLQNGSAALFAETLATAYGKLMNISVTLADVTDATNAPDTDTSTAQGTNASQAVGEQDTKIGAGNVLVDFLSNTLASVGARLERFEVVSLPTVTEAKGDLVSFVTNLAGAQGGLTVSQYAKLTDLVTILTYSAKEDEDGSESDKLKAIQALIRARKN